MKTVFRRLLVIFGVFLLFFIGALFIVTSFFEDQVGERVVSEINAQLKSELEVQAFELSFLRSFPNIGANLQGVSLKGTDDRSLLEAGEISFRAGLWSLLTSNIQIKSVVISDANLAITIDRYGNANYDIFEEVPETEEADTDSNIRIDLKEAIVRNATIKYLDEETNQNLGLKIFNAKFGGQFGATNYQLSSEAELFISQIVSDGELVLKDKPLSYVASVDVNTETNQYKVDQLDLQIGELPLQTSGHFRLSEKATFLDLSFISENGQLEDVLQLLPKAYVGNFEGIETSGDFSLKASVKGTSSAKQQPGITAELRFSDGRISGDRINARVRDLGFVAFYTNGKTQNESGSKFVIENLQGEFDREPFALDLSIENFVDPEIVFSANGTLAPGAMMGFIPDDRITDGHGKVLVENLQLSGRYNDMIRANRSSRVNMRGALAFDGAGFTVNGEDVRLSSGKIILDQNMLIAEEVLFEAPGTHVFFEGRASNILPVLLADSVNSERAILQFNAQLQATELDIDQLLALGAPSEESQEMAEMTGKTDSLAQAEVAKRGFITQFLDGTFQANIQQYNYGEITGEDFEGELLFQDGKMGIKGKTKAMKGEFLLDGEMIFSEEPTLTAKLTGNQIDIHEFFRQSENFGQAFLTADNLEGQLDTRIYIACSFDKEGNFQEDKLRVLAGVGLKNGALKDFAMLEDFSTFVNINDLKEIRFSSLENYFEVKNRKLYLPVMFIQSNALNMTISGEHTFDQDIGYYVKVNAGQIMADRFRRHNSRLRPKPARRKGFFNLYYAILGSLDQYNFTADKRRVQNDFRESDARKRDIHYELERLFGTVIELVEEPLDWRDIPEHEEDPNSTEPEFLDMEIEGGQK